MTDPVRPTPERERHSQVELAARPVLVRPGEHTAPAIAVDILASMQRRGAITGEERLAGERFRAWFVIAQFEALRASDPARPQVDGGTVSPRFSARNERARQQIWLAIQWLGGIRSSAGSCVWHVIGLDESLRQWARTNQRAMSHLNASGVLSVALERLAAMEWLGPDEKSS